MRKQRSRPLEGRPLSERLSLDGHSCEKKKANYDEGGGKSTPAAYRRSAPMPAQKVAIPAPANDIHGNRLCMGWVFDKDRYAVQVTLPKLAATLKRREGAKLYADALEGAYLQIWLIPCQSEAKGRKLVDSLLQSVEAECGAETSLQIRQRKGAGSPQNYSEAEIDSGAAGSWQRSEGGSALWDWTWREGRLDVLGVEFCEAFPRFDGQWAAQIRDPRLVEFFSHRARTRTSGKAVADYGWMRQFMFPCDDKQAARRIIRAALATLPEYEANKDKLEGGSK